MIARNSVILVDQIETEKAHGRHPWDAVVEATMHRFRPILLTAAAAILGMIPIAPTIFWGPMAYAIMGGLAVATLLTLVFLPALYVAWFRIKAPQPEARRERGSRAGRPVQSLTPGEEARDAQSSGGFVDPAQRRRGRALGAHDRLHSRAGPCRRAQARHRGPRTTALLGGDMHIDPPLLISGSALLGALMGGGASLAAAIYTQRCQHRVQDVAREITKRETVYADFVMTASNSAPERVRAGQARPERRRAAPHRAPQPNEALRSAGCRGRGGGGAQGDHRDLAEAGRRPRAAREGGVVRGLDPDPLLAFSLACRADLDNVRRTMVPPPKARRRRKLATMSGLLPCRSEPIDGREVRPVAAEPTWSPGW